MRHTPKRMSMTISLIVLSSLLVGSPFLLPAQEQPAMRAASLFVANIQGTAQIFSRVEREKRKDQSRVLGTSVPENWKPLRPDASIQEGDQLRTGPGSNLELKLNDGTLLTLSGDSLVVVERLRSRRVDEPQTTELFLERGTIKTRQPTQILGQTSQVIRTQNGAVNTQIGEVEVYRPFLPPQETGKNDKTMVNVLRGTAEINSAGEGQMDVKSLLKPSTCRSDDGVRFILKQSQAAVRISKLPDQNAFRASAQYPFQFLVATEGTVNEVRIMTHNSEGEIDLDGLYVATLDPNSSVKMNIHSLLTTGFTMKTPGDVTAIMACNEDPSRGINDFGIQALSGGVTIVRTGLPETVNAPSRGTIGGVVPGPTATPGGPATGLADTIIEADLETDVEAEPTPTPTSTPIPDDDDDDERRPPAGVPIPPLPPAPVPAALTQTDSGVGSHTISPIQVLSCNSQTNGSVSCGQGSCGTNQACVEILFVWNYPSDMINGGGIYLFDPPTPPGPMNECTGSFQSRYIYSEYAGDSVQVSHDGAGTITASFCGPTGVLCVGSYNYALRVADKEFGDVSPCTQFTVP